MLEWAYPPLSYQYDLGIFYAHLHKKILQFTAKNA